MGSVNDVIVAVTGCDQAHTSQVLTRLAIQYPDFTPHTHPSEPGFNPSVNTSGVIVFKLRINGSGKLSPVATAKVLIELAWLLPGNKAQEFRRASADKVRRVLGGDVSLLDEIEQRHAAVDGTPQEEFLLGQKTVETEVQMEPTAMMTYRLELRKLEMEEKKLEVEQQKVALDAPAKRMKMADTWRQKLETLHAFTTTDLQAYQAVVRGALQNGPLLSIEGRGLKEYTLTQNLQLEKNVIKNIKRLVQPGVALAALYRETAKKEPGTKMVEVNGRNTFVKAYTNEQIEGAAEGVTGFALMNQITAMFNLVSES
jgi:hypothetical protein